MPSEQIRPLGSRGEPCKCMEQGIATPKYDWQREMFRNEDLTVNTHNHELLWRMSEAAIGETFDVADA